LIIFFGFGFGTTIVGGGVDLIMGLGSILGGIIIAILTLCSFGLSIGLGISIILKYIATITI
jgi:hypothetical protein